MPVEHGHAQVAEGEGVEAALDQLLDQEDVAGGLSHLCAVGQEVLGVNPVANVLLAEGGFALGNFVLVVGEDVVHATGMEVEELAQVLGSHSGAFNMPAGEAFAPGTVPLDVAARFSGLPQGEVAGVALEGIGLGANALEQVGAGVAGELAVVREAGDIKVDVATALIGVALLQEGPDYGEHFRDVFGGPRVHVGVHDVEPGLVPMKAARV